jgi:hypothetical protein
MRRLDKIWAEVVFNILWVFVPTENQFVYLLNQGQKHV